MPSVSLPREVAVPADLRSFDDDVREPASLQETCIAELGYKPEPARAARLHFELARAATDPGTALKHYRQALENAPDHLPAIRAARALVLEKQTMKAAVAHFDAEMRLAPGAKEKALVLFAKGCALADIAGELQAARDCFNEAVRLDSDNPMLLKAVAHAELKAKEWGKLADALEHEANAVDDHPAHRAAVLVSRARLLERRLNKTSDATAHLEVALALDPETPIALQALKRMCFAQERWRELIGLLENEASLSSDPGSQALAWWSISRIHSERLGSREEAIASLSRAVSITPDDPVLLGELARLYEQAGDRGGLATILEQQANAIARPEERLSVLLRLAELHAGPGGDAAVAARWYESALEIEPGFLPALRALDNLYTRLERWSDLARMCLVEATANVDSPRRAAALERAADIFEMRLGQPVEAAKHHAQALAFDSSNEGAFKALVRLHTDAGRWRELIELYGRAVDGARSEDIAITYLFKIGNIYEDTLRDLRAAADTYKRILARKAEHLGAVHSLQRAAEAAGMWNELVDALDREVQLTPQSEQSLMLQHRAAEVAAERLEDLDGAIARFRHILKRNARHAPALASLGRIYKRLERHSDLLDVFERQLDAASPGPGRVALLLELGEMCEGRLGDAGRAIAYYRQALEADPHHAVARAAVKRLLRESGDNQQLAAVLRAEVDAAPTPQDVARAALLLGEVYEIHLKQFDKAIASYRRAMDAQPGYRPAIDALVRVYGAQGAWKELADTLEFASQAMVDPRAGIDARIRAASIRAERLGQTREATERLERLLAENAADITTLLLLENLYVDTDNRARLADVLAFESQLLMSHGARVAALVSRMRIIEASKDDEALLAACRDVLACEATNVPALETLERLGQRMGDTRLLAEVDTLSSKITTDPAMLALHYTRLGDSLLATNAASALNAYRTAIGHAPDTLSAIRGLGRAASALSDAATMVEAFTREADWTRDGATSAKLLTASAQLRVARLGDAEGGCVDLERALSASPDYAPAAERLTQLLRHSGDVDRLIDRLTNAAQAAKKADRRVTLWRAVGELYATDKQDPGAAITAIKRALEVQPKDTAAIMQLAALHERNTQWQEAADLFERLLSIDDSNVEAHREVAKLYTKQLNDSAKAHSHLRRVLKEAPDDRFALSMLLQLHLESGERDKARAISEQLLEAAAGDDNMRAWALVEIGRVEMRAESHERAADALRQAVSIVGLEGEAAKMYKRLLGENEPWDRYVKALRTHLGSRRSSRPEQSASVYLELARVMHDKMGRTAEAFDTLKEGLARSEDHPALALAAAELMVKTGRLKEAVKSYQGLLSRQPGYADAWRGPTGVLQQLARQLEASLAAGPLVILGEASDVEKNLARERSIRPGAARPNSLSTQALRGISAASPDEDERVALALSVIGDGLSKAFPIPYEMYGVRKSDRLKARSGHSLRQEAERLAAAFGFEDFEMYVHAGIGVDVTVELTQPPSIMVPSYVGELPEAQRVFLLARPLAGIAAGIHHAMKLSPDELALVIAAALRRIVPSYDAGRHDEDRLAQLERELAPSWFSRGRVDEALQHFYAEPVDMAEWAPKAISTMSRAAALIAGDLEASITALRSVGVLPAGLQGADLVKRSPLCAEMLRFWMGEPALEIRRHAGIV
jgi:tetratricopeptide (TPR) repeat protein